MYAIKSPFYLDKKTNYMRLMATQSIILVISERLAMLKLFDEFKGSLSETAAVLDDVKACVVKADEWEQAELVKTANADGSTTWNWNDEMSAKEITLSSEGTAYLLNAITKKSEANEITLADKALVSVSKKLS
jgi:hypothetical protein